MAKVAKLEFRRTMVSVNDILIDPKHNSRNFKLADNRASIESMKADIIANGGVLENLLIRLDDNKKMVLVDGERRYIAVKELNEEGNDEIFVPVARVDAKSESEQLEISLSANTGKVFHQFEYGNAFKKFIKLGWTLEKIAERFSKTERFVRDAIELADGPQSVHEALASGEISVMVALRIIRNNETAASATAAVKEVTEKRAAEGKTKGPAKAAYNKRNLNVKIPTPEFKKLVKFLSEYDSEEFIKWHSAMAAYLPAKETNKEKRGAAAKELDTF